MDGLSEPGRERVTEKRKKRRVGRKTDKTNRKDKENYLSFLK